MRKYNRGGMKEKRQQALEELADESMETVARNNYSEEYRRASDNEDKAGNNDPQHHSSQDSSLHTGTHGDTASSNSLPNKGRITAAVSPEDVGKQERIEERTTNVKGPGRGSRGKGSTGQDKFLDRDRTGESGGQHTGSRGTPGLVNKVTGNDLRGRKKKES